MSDLVQPILLYIGCAIGALGVIVAMPRRGASPQVIGGLIFGAAVGAIFLALGLGVGRSAGLDRLPNINFYVFSIIAIGAALRVVTHQRPVYAALYFILTILASCGLYVLLAAEFMAFALVIVYAGAILITYLFVIMLATEAPSEEEPEAQPAYDRFAREPIGACVAAFVLLGTLTTLLAGGASTLEGPKPAAVNVATVRFVPGVPDSAEDGVRGSEPMAEISLRSDRPANGRLYVAVGGTTLDLDAQTLELGLPLSLSAGSTNVGVPMPGIADAQGRMLDVWFAPAPLGNAGLAAQLPGRIERALREARDPADTSLPYIRADEQVISIDLSRREAVLATVLDSPSGNNTTRLGERRTVAFPAELEIYNVEGVAFTLLDAHPGAIEIAGVILLMAMLGAVVLARKKVEMDDAAKIAAQQRSLVVVNVIGGATDESSPSRTGGRA